MTLLEEVVGCNGCYVSRTFGEKEWTIYPCNDHDQELYDTVVLRD